MIINAGWEPNDPGGANGSAKPKGPMFRRDKHQTTMSEFPGVRHAKYVLGKIS
jgi:hypothetical protein